MKARCNDCGKKYELKKLAAINYPYRYFLCEKCLKKGKKKHRNDRAKVFIKHQKKAAKKAAKILKKLPIKG